MKCEKSAWEILGEGIACGDRIRNRGGALHGGAGKTPQKRGKKQPSGGKEVRVEGGERYSRGGEHVN